MSAVAYIHSRCIKNISNSKYLKICYAYISSSILAVYYFNNYKKFNTITLGIHRRLILTTKSGHSPASIVVIQKGAYLFAIVN